MRRTRIGTYLILGAGLASTLVIGVMTFLATQAHAQQLMRERLRSASQLSESIRSSTHFDMLENRRDSLHRQIRTIGGLHQEGIRRVRLFNKEGRIMFSSEAPETGTVVDTRGEACYACHAEGKPLEKLDIQARARIFRGGEGQRVLGIIQPIPNEPGCYTAECHAHSQSQRVLGVLDVHVALDEVDRDILMHRILMSGLAVLAVAASSFMLWWLNRRLVLRPVRALMEGTERVAAGDLTTVIDVHGDHELGQLGKAFNRMTRQLSEIQGQLAQADKLASVGRLAAGVAHEINNPLTGVLSYASLLKPRVQEDPQATEDLEVVIRETQRCRGIIKELLEFARPSPPDFRSVDLHEVIRRALAVALPPLDFEHITVRQDLAHSLPTIQADPHQIQQVLVNLLLNAADALGEKGGEVRITTRLVAMGAPARTTWVEMRVEDDGHGIRAEDLSRLFEPFFSTKGPKGTGLGLSVTWGILERHGGTIHVESEPGHGACFTLRLPVSSPESEARTL